MVRSRVPRRASRNLTRWQRFKRWLSSFSPEEQEWHAIVNKPSVRQALRRMANEVRERVSSDREDS
jgi:hypothetical protein